MNKKLLKAISVFYKVAEDSLKATIGNELLKTAVHITIDNTMLTASIFQIDSGLGTYLKEFEDFIKNDPRMVSISYKDPTKITFFQKIPDTDISEIDSDDKKRGITTLNRYIRRIFIKDYIDNDKPRFETIEYTLNDKFIEAFVDKVNLNISKSIDLIGKDLNEISGDDLQEFYKNFDSQSCMKGGDSIKMQLLSNNPDKVVLLTMNEKAKALLWTADDGTKILDRIYPSGSKYIMPFRGWAKKKGYVLRENPDQLISTRRTVELSDGKTYEITLNVGDVRIFPYLDTFRFGEFTEDLSELTLSNHINFGDCLFAKTDGSFVGMENYNIEIESEYRCADCEEAFNPDYEGSGINAEGEGVCLSCAENYTSCDGCGTITSNDDIQTLSGSAYCADCFDEKVYTCTDCEDYFDFESDGGYYNEDGDFYCNDCASEYPKCEDCKNLIFNKNQVNTIYNENGDVEIYCNDCLDVDKVTSCKRCHKTLSYSPDNKICNECKEEIREYKHKKKEEAINSKQTMLPFSEEEEDINKIIADASLEIKSLLIIANSLQKISN